VQTTKFQGSHFVGATGYLFMAIKECHPLAMKGAFHPEYTHIKEYLSPLQLLFLLLGLWCKE
jgi:hypothetical protein